MEAIHEMGAMVAEEIKHQTIAYLILKRFETGMGLSDAKADAHDIYRAAIEVSRNA